jgi:hypothetical protein
MLARRLICVQNVEYLEVIFISIQDTGPGSERYRAAMLRLERRQAKNSNIKKSLLGWLVSTRTT